MIGKIINLTALGLLIASGSVYAQSLNIDFGGEAGTPLSTYSAAAGQSGIWTTVTSETTSTVYNLAGTASGVTISTTYTGDWLAFNGYSGSGNGAGNAFLDDNFFVPSGCTWMVTISNLANGTYSVYYYAPNSTSVATGDFTINGAACSSINGNDVSGSANLVEGTSYDVLANIEVTNGTLTLTSGSSTSYAGLAGLQLVLTSVPEPSAFALAGGLVALFTVMLRKRSRA
jgi:hypothetical protein